MDRMTLQEFMDKYKIVKRTCFEHPSMVVFMSNFQISEAVTAIELSKAKNMTCLEKNIIGNMVFNLVSKMGKMAEDFRKVKI